MGSAHYAADVDHTFHGSCPGKRSDLGLCRCPDDEIVVASTIVINERTQKITTELEPHLTRRCSCCGGAR